jgi:nicotinate-nucleotide adenylyltransferase
MKIGICGGTFDPFHRGHLDPVLGARDTMQWERVMYIVAYRQPFKAERATTSGYDRFAMAVLATEPHDALFVSHMELDRGAISYSVETLEELRAMNPEATLDWIIGDDNLPELKAWRNLDRIFELANFAVLTRGGQAILPDAAKGRAGLPDLQARVASPESRPRHGAICFVRNATVPISATDIRKKVRERRSIDGLVDPRVSRYIHRHRLYEEANT